MTQESRSPNLGEVLAIALQEGISKIKKIQPGKILSYDKLKQTAEIELMLESEINYVEGVETEQVKPLPDVPILFLRTKKCFGPTMPLERGDFVLVLFCDRSIEKYMDSTGVAVDPVYRHMHDHSDAVAFPTFFPFAHTIKDINTDGLAFGYDNKGMQLVIKESGSLEVTFGGGDTLVVEGQAATATLTLGLGIMHPAIAEKLEILWNQSKIQMDAFILSHVHGPPGSPPVPIVPPITFPAWNSAIKSNKVSFPDG